jgi:uncharacterized integral membrane protein
MTEDKRMLLVSTDDSTGIEKISRDERTGEGKKIAPEEISKIIGIWKRGSDILRFLHIFIGTVAIVLTITVASKLVDASHWSFPLITWGAAISTALLTSFNLGEKSNNMRNAWRKLNAAKMNYEFDPTAGTLVKAYEEGEKLIGDVSVKL